MINEVSLKIAVGTEQGVYSSVGGRWMVEETGGVRPLAELSRGQYVGKDWILIKILQIIGICYSVYHHWLIVARIVYLCYS